jgi:hypothetical protein
LSRQALFGDEKGSNQGLEKLGFPWILSSDSSLFNGLRPIFCGIFFMPVPSRQPELSRSCRAVRFAVHAGRSVRRHDIPGIEVRDSLLQFEAGRSPVPMPLHPEAADRFWQDIVGNSDFTDSGDGVDGAAPRRNASGAVSSPWRRWRRARSGLVGQGPRDGRLAVDSSSAEGIGVIASEAKQSIPRR